MHWGLIFDNALRAAVSQEAIVFALAAIGLNLHFGWTGLANFGQSGFLAVGAYGIGISVATWGFSMWAGVFIGIVGAVVLALLLGIPTLRLRADYLAITTIAASEILRLCFRSVTFSHTTGGSTGLSQFAGDFYRLNPLNPGRYGFGPLRFSADRAWLLLVGWALVALVSFFVFLLMRSPWGRVLRSIREDEDAARSLGKNVFVYKMQSLVLGGVIGALGGMIFAIGTQSVQPDNYGTAITFFAYAALMLGGAARVFGPVIGSALFWVVLSFSDNVLRQLVSNGNIPTSIMSGVQVGIVRQMLVGLGLMLLVIFRPQGILGDKREIALDG